MRTRATTPLRTVILLILITHLSNACFYYFFLQYIRIIILSFDPVRFTKRGYPPQLCASAAITTIGLCVIKSLLYVICYSRLRRYVNRLVYHEKRHNIEVRFASSALGLVSFYTYIRYCVPRRDHCNRA